jgi:RNA polymerase sigma-70 factor, ECF subfamily
MPKPLDRTYSDSWIERLDKHVMANSSAQIHLIRRAQAGDSEAFSSLYESHRRQVYSICLRITREPSEAEDCSQEAFLQCFLQLSTFRGDSALSTWLYRLTVNVVLMRLRANKKRPVSIELGSSSEGGETSYLNLFPVKDLQLAGTIDRVVIGRAVRRLPNGYRKIFLLHDVRGMAHSEIARKLGCTIGTSKSQLHQARLQLRRFLGRPAAGRRYKQRNPVALKSRVCKTQAKQKVTQSLWIPATGTPAQFVALM